MHITIPDLPDGLIVSVDKFFKFRRVAYRRAAKSYKCDECGEPIERSESPRARKYMWMSWASKKEGYVTPSGRHTEVTRVCPKCVALWQTLATKVRNLDEIQYTFMPGKLIELGEEVYRIYEQRGKLRE